MASTSEPTLCQLYGKDSFSRFGGDLCQHLLSYLTLKDRFRFECVSKEWQTLVYETQEDIRFGRRLDEQSFELILKNCRNITRIVPSIGFVDNSMVKAMIRHCNHLHTIRCLKRRYNGFIFPKVCQTIEIN
jgi:hypothetical protein